MNWKLWLKGLIAAMISGGSSAVSAGFAVNLTDPTDFNANGGLGHLLKVMTTVFVVAGVLGAAGYLRKSPVPDDPK